MGRTGIVLCSLVAIAAASCEGPPAERAAVDSTQVIEEARRFMNEYASELLAGTVPPSLPAMTGRAPTHSATASRYSSPTIQSWHPIRARLGRNPSPSNGSICRLSRSGTTRWPIRRAAAGPAGLLHHQPGRDGGPVRGTGPHGAGRGQPASPGPVTFTTSSVLNTHPALENRA
jgi:hypothetical protein